MYYLLRGMDAPRNHLEQHFHREDCSEDEIQVVQNGVAEGIRVNGIFDGERYGAGTQHKQHEDVEEPQVDCKMGESSDAGIK